MLNRSATPRWPNPWRRSNRKLGLWNWTFRSIAIAVHLAFHSPVQPIHFAVLTLAMCFGVTFSSAGDVVTEPLRRYGLGDLQQVSISPDARWMATSGGGGAFLWDFQTGTVSHRLEAHHTRVLALCFSPDSQVLLTGGLDRTIRAWRTDSGEEFRSFQAHQGEIQDLAFAPDGQSFVSVGDNTARVWSLDTGELRHTFGGTDRSFVRARFTPDGDRLVTADAWLTNSVQVWDLTTGQSIRSFGDLVHTFGFSAGGHLVTSGSDQIARVWDLENGQLIRPLPGAEFVVGLLSSTNSFLVIAGCHNGRVITWDTSTGSIQHDFRGEPLVALAAIPGTNKLLTAHADKLVRVKNSEIGDNLRAFAGHTTSSTTGVGFSRDGRIVVSSGTELFTRLWNRTNAQQVGMLPGHGAGSASVAFSPDGTRILTTFGGPIFSAQVWNIATGSVEREFFGHTQWLLAAVFSPDGRSIATGAQDGTARLWDVASGTSKRVFPAPNTWVSCVAVSSNGTLLASGGTDGIARIWNTANGQLVRTFEMNAGGVVDVAFSPATGDLLVAWADGFLRLFDPATGEIKLDQIAPAAFLHAAVFSPDGRFILGGEGWPLFTARLWDARTGEELRVFAGHGWSVDSVAFNASGTSILTGSDIVRLWSIADIAARLEHKRTPNGLELSWHAGILQHSAHVNGPWFPFPNATSPWRIPTDQAAEYFRVEVNEEE